VRISCTRHRHVPTSQTISTRYPPPVTRHPPPVTFTPQLFLSLKKNLKKIPLYKQDAAAIGGLDIKYVSGDVREQDRDFLQEHRDDHYIFLVLLKGKGAMRCDMTEISTEAPGLLLVKPFQVHAPADDYHKAEGYFVSVDTFLVPAHCGEVFRDLSIDQQVLPLGREEKKYIVETMKLLHHAFGEKNIFTQQIIQGLFSSLVNRIAALYSKAGTRLPAKKNQAQLLTASFRKLLSEGWYLRPPSWFAGQLNITTSHLNDSVKEVTGYSCTYWLQDAMITEARRLLYYTNNDVKEVAFALGFEDAAYFSRLFKKVTGETALAFRNKFRE